nr:MAG TPA: hypothetical protein [Caudoviricetes sp.]
MRVNKVFSLEVGKTTNTLDNERSRLHEITYLICR